jgi:hypothetical protein
MLNKFKNINIMNYSVAIRPICKLSEIKDTTYVKQTLYVVSNKEKTISLVYEDNEINNTDRVRSAFAKQTGTKFTDTRCSRIKNINLDLILKTLN